MTPLLILSCKRCGSPVEPGPSAHVRGRVLLDLACGACGKRALYEVTSTPAAGN